MFEDDDLDDLFLDLDTNVMKPVLTGSNTSNPGLSGCAAVLRDSTRSNQNCVLSSEKAVTSTHQRSMFSQDSQVDDVGDCNVTAVTSSSNNVSHESVSLSLVCKDSTRSKAPKIVTSTQKSVQFGAGAGLGLGDMEDIDWGDDIWDNDENVPGEGPVISKSPPAKKLHGLDTDGSYVITTSFKKSAPIPRAVSPCESFSLSPETAPSRLPQSWGSPPPPINPPKIQSKVLSTAPVAHSSGPQRLFPGPAGLLPRITPSTSHSLVVDPGDWARPGEGGEDRDPGLSLLHIQTLPAWLRARSELQAMDRDRVAESYNTAWVRSRGKEVVQATTSKMPVFLCVIRSLDLSCVDPPCRLGDEQGEVEGSLHREVLEKHGKEVGPGTVLLLRNVVVLLANKTQYVNITCDNLVSIYLGESSPSHVHTMTPHQLEEAARIAKTRERRYNTDSVSMESSPTLSCNSNSSLCVATPRPTARPRPVSMSRCASPGSLPQSRPNASNPRFVFQPRVQPTLNGSVSKHSHSTGSTQSRQAAPLQSRANAPSRFQQTGPTQSNQVGPTHSRVTTVTESRLTSPTQLSLTAPSFQSRLTSPSIPSGAIPPPALPSVTPLRSHPSTALAQSSSNKSLQPHLAASVVSKCQGMFPPQSLASSTSQICSTTPGPSQLLLDSLLGDIEDESLFGDF